MTKAINLLVVILIGLLIWVGVDLITARKQLRAIETAVSGCKKLNTRHLIIQPVNGCNEANPTVLVGYKK